MTRISDEDIYINQSRNHIHATTIDEHDAWTFACSNDMITCHFIHPHTIQHISLHDDLDSLLKLVICQSASSFHPKYTYTFYGDDQRVRIPKKFSMILLMSTVSIKTVMLLCIGSFVIQPEKHKEIYSILEDTIVKPFINKIPNADIIVNDLCRFLQILREELHPGESHSSLLTYLPRYTYQTENSIFNAYHMDMNDSRARSFIDCLQLLVLFFIEGGSCIDSSDSKWQCYMILNEHEYMNENQMKKSTILVGFVTLYGFLYFPDKVRMRISQFVILPPFQRQGHGRRLYQITMSELRECQRVIEVPVEDPNPHFANLRDKCDLEVISQDRDIKNVLYATEMKDQSFKPLVNNISKRYKLTFKQTEHVLEISFDKLTPKKSENHDGHFIADGCKSASKRLSKDNESWNYTIEQRLVDTICDYNGHKSEQELKRVKHY